MVGSLPILKPSSRSSEHMENSPNKINFWIIKKNLNQKKKKNKTRRPEGNLPNLKFN